MIERTILTNLERANHGMSTMTTLWAEVSLDLPDANYTEFKKAVGDLERKEQILVIKGEDREKAKITDLGKARLLER